MNAVLSSIQSFFFSLTEPKEIKTNQDTDLLRLIACLCMVIDHAGKMFFPQLDWMRLVGRTAFPLFAYGIAVGAAKTHHPLHYLRRIAGLALLSQPLYSLALAHENAAMFAHPFLKNPFLSVYSFYMNSWKKPSILLTLFLGLCLLLCLRYRQYAGALLFLVIGWRFAEFLDYGFYGLLLMVVFYISLEHPVLGLVPLAVFFFSWALSDYGTYPLFGLRFGMRLFALPALLLTRLPMKRNLRLPHWFSYGFDPAHLAVIALLVHL